MTAMATAVSVGVIFNLKETDMEMTRPPFKDWTIDYNRGNPTKKYALNWLKLFNGNVVVQPKYDGRWGLLHHEADSDTITLYSRHGKIQKQATNFRLKKFPEFKMHGEYIFGTSFAKQSDLEGKLIVFDFEGNLRGYEPTLSNRMAFGLQNVLLLQQIGFDWIEMIESDVLFGHTDTELITAILNGKRYGKVEGVVLKQATSEFGDPWVRIKPIYDMDYVVMGFNQSDADSFKGKMVKSVIGGLYIDGELKEVCNVSGLANSDRASMYTNPEKYIGKVMTCTGKDIFKSGALRHPNFLRMHPEKQAQECTLP